MAIKSEIVLMILSLAEIGLSELGYLKFCGDKHKHVVQSTSCYKGLWLNVPIKPGCVCAKGVWALSDGLCDMKTAIIVGDDHCFHAGFDVRAVKYVGNVSDPFAGWVGTSGSEVDGVEAVPGRGFSPSIPSHSAIVIGINPGRRALERDDGTCLQLRHTHQHKPLHIYINPDRSHNKWQFTSSCPNPLDYTHHLAFGEMFKSSKVLSKEFIGRNCEGDCPATNPLRFEKTRAFSRSRGGRPVVMAEGRMLTLGWNRTLKVPPPQKSASELEAEAKEERAKVRLDMDDFHQETNEQTLRMVHSQISPLLLDVRTNQIYSREYEYFQKARTVVKNLCPEEYVPDNLVDGLMRMFRQLLWETMRDRSHSEGSDGEQFGRILEILDNCTAPQDIAFQFMNYTGSYNFTGANASAPDWPQPEQCPEPLVFGVNGTDIDGKPKVLQNVTGYFHPHLKFNTSLVDFVVETAWKIVMIAHYQCSKSFNGTTAADFSTFFHQVELFFNDKIIKRWYDPVNVQNMYKVVQLIFPTYDLKRFAFGLDICMFAAQQFSDFAYNSKWIQRPKIPFNSNDMTQFKYLIPGLEPNQSISTNDYAPKIARRKRDAGMWDGKGYCMDSFQDPVNIFGYEPKPGCRFHNSLH